MGEGFVSLDTVLADDLDRSEVELHDHDGHAVGTVGLVSRRALGLIVISVLLLSLMVHICDATVSNKQRHIDAVQAWAAHFRYYGAGSERTVCKLRLQQLRRASFAGQTDVVALRACWLSRPADCLRCRCSACSMGAVTAASWRVPARTRPGSTCTAR